MAFTMASSLLLPLYISTASAVILLSTLGLKLRVKSSSEHASGTHSHGGRTIFAFKVARLVGCLVLLSLSVVVGDKSEGLASTRRAALCATYLYACALAIVSVASGSRVVVPHLNTVLFSTFAVYVYRDVFPLATFTLVPKDLAQGPLLWAQVGILFVVAVVIPLLIPREYIPVDPKNSMPQVNPEQTASILSLALYTFLDTIIFRAYRVPHLEFDQLPPLPDYDSVENLKPRAFPHMDVFAGKKRHVLVGLIWVFRWKLAAMVVVLVILPLSTFIPPIALNRLLNYLENPAEESTMKPWFWILLLFVGQVTIALSFQRYLFLMTRLTNNVTAIISQLVFEHALRIRVKAETAGNNAKAADLQGQMTNLLTTDLANIINAKEVLLLFTFIPLQVIFSIVFLYQIFGLSSFVGTGITIAMLPLPGYIAKWQQTVQKQTMQKIDARVQTVTETVNVLRMIKMLGWEMKTEERIASKREEELTWIWRRRLLEISTRAFNNALVPSLTMLASFELSASKVFASMAVFDMLRFQLGNGFFYVSSAINGKVSLDRLNEFLHNTELLDSFSSQNTSEVLPVDESASDVVGFRDATFAWSNDEADGSLTPSSRRFLLKIEGELLFKSDCVNLVVGPTGSLTNFTGEMHFIPSSPSSWYNLPRGEGVAYAAQESWVQNDTIRNNIIFTSPVNEERYKKVLYQCCLERDLDLFDAGDQTEVGEKGLTLSGGQKARVTLARAIYSDAKIIILDDILAPLDVHTAKWIVDKCLRGDLIKGRTVILVTHNVVLASETAGFVVSLSNDGRILSQGSISDALARDENLAKEVQKDQEILEKAEEEIDSPPVDQVEKKDCQGKLIVAEEIEIGRVRWTALNLLFSGMGGPLFFALYLLSQIAQTAGFALQTWYLGFWASQYGQGVPVPVFKHLGNLSGILFVAVAIGVFAVIFYAVGAFRASRIIHKKLVDSILGTTFRWLDVTPVSRIIARCTVDMGAVDGTISAGFRTVIEMTVEMVIKFFAIMIFAPLFWIGGILFGVVVGIYGQIYMASQLSVKREMSNAKAPVIAHFGATVAGLASVRAYGAQEAWIKISMERINRLSRATCTFMDLGRWVNMRSTILGGLFASSLAVYLVYFQDARPFNTGFTLNQALSFSNLVLWWVQTYNDFEVQASSLERLQQYIAIEQEPKPTKDGVPPAYWPASGSLSVQKLSARYSADGPEVLHDVSFNIQSGERVGVVGRTGSGKSSLTLSLLRCIFTEGEVYYDNIPTSTLNLDALRSNITIIPQVPELLVGTLRSNLDPFDQFDDATLNDALRAAGLSALQDEMEEGKLTLDSEISGGGGNLSVGQRQIIALARAIVRGSKLMILDEATSAIDYKTDAVIQKSLRELPSDTTLFTVAHRLQTIMDADKIMVLDAGRVVEYDAPKTLLQKKDGLLRALVDESGDREALYKMARA
ncbi:hypothetical protein FB45DRAFT_891892 [Roridomyces roridus]|uniref:P-loop containing nucleoside triphosphate hydrolase protein n=1 Tax=Roridomyces roridus TaxID=1738132 RepID=A0AAD7CEG7_9AGAR|nr:hypothetical protein FB45DRAFT_891892 [Roridomyces roridus]